MVGTDDVHLCQVVEVRLIRDPAEVDHTICAREHFLQQTQVTEIRRHDFIMWASRQHRANISGYQVNPHFGKGSAKGSADRSSSTRDYPATPRNINHAPTVLRLHAQYGWTFRVEERRTLRPNPGDVSERRTRARGM
ncbi:hypothetical protein StoSoilB20_07390 [Arthrobacter sp. StoSoilB20]|nr:hypothetical protein StoSoilB20_07390 [Arthrobacter sp. StoSoilB20]